MSPLDLAFIPAVAGVLLAWFYTWKAYRNLSDRGDREILYHPLALPLVAPFARREHFTELGWRYRNRALAVSMAGVVISILLASLV